MFRLGPGFIRPALAQHDTPEWHALCVCATLPSALRVIAILGPNASVQDLERFRVASESVEITPAATISAPADAALILGGDGTIHRHLPALAETKIPTLIVPTGSGNDFARALGLAKMRFAAAAWRRFCSSGNNLRELDLGSIQPLSKDHDKAPLAPFSCIASIGLDSEVNRIANGYPRWLRAHGGYLAAVPPALASFRPFHLTIRRDDGHDIHSEPATLCAFANASSYGDGMRIAPRAQLDDGLLDICFVRSVSKLRLLQMFPSVYRGTHLRFREISYSQTNRVEVTSDRPMDVYADGEFVCRTPVRISIMPKAMRVIC
ncbi:MAG TPA: diacylglycerol kinase family protein [Terriglobales bacterium]|nr:diacylglycerol kinase family protein [Terriglobales bacterium]